MKPLLTLLLLLLAVPASAQTFTGSHGMTLTVPSLDSFVVGATTPVTFTISCPQDTCRTSSFSVSNTNVPPLNDGLYGCTGWSNQTYKPGYGHNWVLTAQVNCSWKPAVTGSFQLNFSASDNSGGWVGGAVGVTAQ